jgi:hypothetical protein
MAHRVILLLRSNSVVVWSEADMQASVLGNHINADDHP